jgi:hypothetical protein
MFAVAVGSAARGDNDVTSDRDLVLIGDPSFLDATSAKYSLHGWSVVSMTQGRFAFLGAAGSLFLKHVISEGRLLAGDATDWEAARTRWIARRDYLDEIEENLDFLKLLQYVPETCEGMTAAVDIIACSIRNILIRRLAAKGLFYFAWAEVLSHSSKVVSLPSGAWSAMAWARQCKNLHRSGRTFDIEARKLVELSEIFREVLGGELVRFSNRAARVERMVETFADYSYGQLRGYEMVVAHRPFDPAFLQMRPLLRKPSYFCSGRFSA